MPWTMHDMIFGSECRTGRRVHGCLFEREKRELHVRQFSESPRALSSWWVGREHSGAHFLAPAPEPAWGGGGRPPAASPPGAEGDRPKERWQCCLPGPSPSGPVGLECLGPGERCRTPLSAGRFQRRGSQRIAYVYVRAGAAGAGGRCGRREARQPRRRAGACAGAAARRLPEAQEAGSAAPPALARRRLLPAAAPPCLRVRKKIRPTSRAAATRYTTAATMSTASCVGLARPPGGPGSPRPRPPPTWSRPHLRPRPPLWSPLRLHVSPRDRNFLF